MMTIWALTPCHRMSRVNCFLFSILPVDSRTELNYAIQLIIHKLRHTEAYIKNYENSYVNKKSVS